MRLVFNLPIECLQPLNGVVVVGWRRERSLSFHVLEFRVFTVESEKELTSQRWLRETYVAKN